MTDINEFAEEGFDLKAWINRTCAQSPSDEPLEKFLAEVEMRLQLTAEEIESSLHDLSVQAMRRIPFAVQEIYRLRGDIQGMQDQLGGLAAGVKRDASAAMESVADLQQLDKVKRNMESAFSTLKEATELSGLFVKVEEVFAAGDLPHVAAMLSSMRRSLSLVGDVPEFRAGRQRLHALEDRLQGMIEGSLAEALTRGQDTEAIKKLCGLLLAVDRLSTVENLYCASRLASVESRWEELSQGGAAPPAQQQLLSWLPAFLSWLASFLDMEASWCHQVLPAQQLQLIASLAKTVFRKVSHRIKEKLSSSAVAAQLSRPGAVSLLVGLQRELAGVATSVAGLLKGADVEVRREVLSLALSPVEERVSSYGNLEQTQLAAELAVSAPKPGPATSAEELVALMSASSKSAFSVLHQAVERCMAFTGGTELRNLMRVVDQELSGLLSQLQSATASLHDRYTGTGGASDAARRTSEAGAGARDAAQPASAAAAGALGYGDDSEEVAAALRLLLVYVDLSAGLNRLEGEIRTTISGVVPKLELAAERGRDAPADALALRLAASPDKLARARRLLGSLQELRFIALPGAAAALEALHTCIEETLSDALLAKVKVQLRVLPDMAEWKRTGPATASPVSLPSFNAYPLPYVTTLGEYLMTMPQQLEVLMSDDGAATSAGTDADVEELAAEWLDKVVSGAAALYVEQVLRIPELGLQGGAQLAADVEYFCNVMSALHGSPPPGLLTVQLFAGLPPELFVDAARQAAADGGADAAMLRALAGMRRITLG